MAANDPTPLTPYYAKLRDLEQRVDELTLKAGGGGGTSGGMEPRVAKLEAHMEHVRSDLAKLADVPAALATLTANVSHLPGKGFVVTAAVSTVTAIVGLLVLLQKTGVLH